MMKQTVVVQKSSSPTKPTYKNYQNFLNNYGNNQQRKDEFNNEFSQRVKHHVYKTEKHVEIVETANNCDSSSAINNVSKNNPASQTSSSTEEEFAPASSVSQRIADLLETKQKNETNNTSGASQVSECAKIFETKTKEKPSSETNALSNRISQFEKPKIKAKTFTNTVTIKPSSPPPPPPPEPALNEQTVGKLHATLASHQISLTFDNPDGVDPKTLDRNDPLAKKVANGALKNLFGNYHQKANNIVAGMPSEMVQKDNNISQIIQNLASNGDLEKLCGRVQPPKTLEE